MRRKVPWCSGCGAARSVDEEGEVTFDSSQKADRQTLAEAERAASPRADGLRGAARRRPVRLRKKRHG